MTGLSGAGKTTIATGLKKTYPKIVILDGDDIRTGLSSDLGFSIEDRNENLRRLIEVCKLLNKNDIPVIASFISPFDEMRVRAKKEIPLCKIIYVKTSLEECENRDVKGLYKKVRNGEIENFTGITSPFEEPTNADLILDTETTSINECVTKTYKAFFENKDWSI